MSYIRNVDEINLRKAIYIKGDANTDGSIRMVSDEQQGVVFIQKRVQGIFQSTGFKSGPLSHDDVITEDVGHVVTNLSGNFIVTT